MKPEHIEFYLMGRDSKVLPYDPDDILDEIVKRIETGTAVHIAVRDLANEAAKSFQADLRKRRRFLSDNELEDNADAAGAWDAYVQGKIDELVSVLEPAVVEDLEGHDDEDEEEEGEDDDDDEDEIPAEGAK